MATSQVDSSIKTKKKNYLVMTSHGNVFEVRAANEPEARKFAFSMMVDPDDSIDSLECLEGGN